MLVRRKLCHCNACHPGGAAAGDQPGLCQSTGLAQRWVLRRPLALSRWWVVSSLIGGALGLAVGMQLAEAVPVTAMTKLIRRNAETLFAPGTAFRVAISGLLFGLLLGLWQWFVLRYHVDNVAWWVVATAIGWATALWPADGSMSWFVIYHAINHPGHRTSGPLRSFGCIGSNTTTPYCLRLCRKNISQSETISSGPAIQRQSRTVSISVSITPGVVRTQLMI